MSRKTEPVVLDDDNPEWTAEDFATARPGYEMPPEMLARFPNTPRRGVRGAQKAPTKVQVAVRLSPDVVERLKSGGPGWHRRIDDMLRKSLGL